MNRGQKFSLFSGNQSQERRT